MNICNPLIILALLLVSACDSPTNSSTPEKTAQSAAAMLAQEAGAPLLQGLGDFSHPITTAHPGAQRYFDQGMVMASGFNHAEAIRAFQAAQRLDPACAMCYWGEALARGPNINVTSKGKVVMPSADRLAAYVAIQKALALKSGVSEAEQDYIDAQTTRYNGDPATPREPLDLAYADAMRQLAHKHPLDDDAQALFAEALMNTMPWDYWIDGTNPKPATAEVIAALETVIARNPDHALAAHLYIHAVEASSRPGRAEAAADALANLVPGSGHLVHMPSHIYWRIGRYYDASEVNVRAAAVDEAYIAQCNAQGFYPAMYYPHNIHFLWASATMEGRSAIAIEAGEKVAANIRLEQIEKFPTVEFFHTIPLLSLVRFARWEEILQAPQPQEKLQFSNAIWHYARGMAALRTGDVTAARLALGSLQALQSHQAIYHLDGNDYPASQILAIADELLRGEMALDADDMSAAIGHFTTAVKTQDALPYTEPPFWYYPTRQSLGHALLQAGDASAAEQVYRDDLRHYPRNGWSLFGLALSLEQQDKTAEAAAARERFNNIWARADVVLTSSIL